MSRRPGTTDDWNTHWSQFGTAAERNPAQRYRRLLALDLLSDGGEPRRIVDIGSGTGELLAEASARWPRADLLGLEISDIGVQVARQRVPQATFFVSDLLTGASVFPGYRGWATHAVCSEVLEHVDDPVRLLRNSLAWLEPGARLVVTVPGGPISAFDRHIGHRRHFSPADLASLLRAAGVDVVRTAAAGFPFFNLYRLVVVARGDRLVVDVSSGDAGVSRVAGVAMRMFDTLLPLNRRGSRWGWQTIGVGRLLEPDSEDAASGIPSFPGAQPRQPRRTRSWPHNLAP